MVLTFHAIERFQQRVRDVSAEDAARRIRDAVSHSRAQPKPRWWTPVAKGKGHLFIYPQAMPGVCFLVRDGAIITVFVRSQCRAWQRTPDDTVRRAKRLPPYRRPSPGSVIAEAA